MLLLLTGVTMTSCTRVAQEAAGPLKVAVNYVEHYDQWAQDGYSSPIPEALRVASSSATLEILKNDQSWYAGGGVRQRGSVRVVSSELVEASNTKAVVRLTIDSTDIEVLAEGQPTFMSDERVHVTEFTLEKSDRWRVTTSIPAG